MHPKNVPSIAFAPAYGLPPNRESGSKAAEPRSSDPFVRVVTTMCMLSAVLGVLVLPGLLGSVGERAVIWAERATAMSSYLAFLGLMLLTSSGGYALIQRADLGPSRYVLLGLSVIVVGLVGPSVSTHLIAIPQAMLGFAASTFALVAAFRAVRAPHTRAPAGVLGLLAIGGLLRVLAWTIASLSLDSPRGFSFARGLGTAAVVSVGFAQLVAVAYFATRGKVQGRFLGNFALFLGFVATYLAARKPGFVGPIGHILAGALSLGAPSPEPFGLSPVAHFLFPTAIFLALVALVQRRQVTSIACGLTLVLASQGRFDVPLSAFFAVVGGLLLVLSSNDDRAMWTDLLTTRDQKAADERDSDAPPPPKSRVPAPRAEDKAVEASPADPSKT